MAKIYKANVNTAAPVVVQNKTTGIEITDGKGNIYSTTETGNITVPLVTEDQTNYIIREFPLSQFGDMYDDDILNITSSTNIISFNEEIPVFMSGVYFKIPSYSTTLTLNNTTYYVYVNMVQGTASYNISSTEEPETDVNMFIGTVQTGTGVISSINISKVSRFSTFRPSINQIGGAFPVSTGHPSQTGTINW